MYHSFTNASSYNEWDIEVVYVDEPSYEYFYALQNDEIVMTGSMGTTKTSKHEYVANNLINEIGVSDCYNEIKYASAEERELILGIFSNLNWKEETAECANDAYLNIQGDEYYYHSDCGTINDNVNKRHAALSDEKRDKLNDILSNYISLGGDSE